MSLQVTYTASTPPVAPPPRPLAPPLQRAGDCERPVGPSGRDLEDRGARAAPFGRPPGRLASPRPASTSLVLASRTSPRATPLRQQSFSPVRRSISPPAVRSARPTRHGAGTANHASASAAAMAAAAAAHQALVAAAAVPPVEQLEEWAALRCSLEECEASRLETWEELEEERGRSMAHVEVREVACAQLRHELEQERAISAQQREENAELREQLQRSQAMLEKYTAELGNIMPGMELLLAQQQRSSQGSGTGTTSPRAGGTTAKCASPIASRSKAAAAPAAASRPPAGSRPRSASSSGAVAPPPFRAGGMVPPPPQAPGLFIGANARTLPESRGKGRRPQ